MFRLALKTVLYYRGRSVTTFVLTFISGYFFIVYVAFMDGSHESMLRNSLNIYTGSMQLYQKEYRDEGGFDYLIFDNKKYFKLLEQTEGIKAFSSRLEVFGIASHKERSCAIMLTGVDFKRESTITVLKSALTAGVYQSTGNCLYAGSGLAKRLNVNVGDEISFIGSAVDYSFVAELFKVCGIFKTGMYMFDLQSAFMNRSYFDSVFYSDNASSYIVITADDLSSNDEVAAQIKLFLNSDVRLYTWQELMASMVEMMEIDSIFGYVSMGLFFLVIFFVIMIFGFINASSRVRGFGTLKSIGISNRQIDLLLLYEMMILTLSALLIATPLGAYTAFYFEQHPLVIEGMSEVYKDYGVVADTVPTRFDLFTVFWNVALIVLLNLLSILYPIRYIRAFTPVEAMRHV